MQMLSYISTQTRDMDSSISLPVTLQPLSMHFSTRTRTCSARRRPAIAAFNDQKKMGIVPFEQITARKNRHVCFVSAITVFLKSQSVLETLLCRCSNTKTDCQRSLLSAESKVHTTVSSCG